jgi:translocation and assembly module TamB
MSAHASTRIPARTRGLALAPLLKRIALVLAVLLLIVLGLSFWLLRTESGLQFVLARAIGATEGKLAIGTSSGHLGGLVTLDQVRYRDAEAGFDVQVRRVTIAHAPLELLASRLHVTRLEVDGVDIALATVEPPPEPEPEVGEFSLEAPLDIVLDRLVVSDAKLARDGAELARLDSLDVVVALDLAAGLLVLLDEHEQARAADADHHTVDVLGDLRDERR